MEQTRPAGRVARAAHRRVVSIDPVKAAAVGIRREVTCSAKRRIDNVADRKASGSRVFSAVVVVVIVGVAEVIVSEAEANANGLVVVDDDKNLNSDGG